MLWSICLVAAIVGGTLIDGEPQKLLAAALSAMVLASCARGRLRRVLGMAACVALAAAHGSHARDGVLHSPLIRSLNPVLDDRLAPPVWLRGSLDEDAVSVMDGVRLEIQVVGVHQNGGWSPTDGRAQIVVGGEFVASASREWRRGRTVILPAIVRRPSVWRNPGSGSDDWQRLRRGIDITGSVKSARLVSVARGSWSSEAAARLRAWTRRAVHQTVAAWSSESEAVVTALLIGDRTGLDDDTIRRLQAAGTYHVIAISGGNIALLVILSLTLLRLVARGPRLAAVGALVIVLAYGVVVGDQASVSRAVTAACVVLGLEAVGLCAHALRVFWLAALLVVIADPLTVIDVGAWLSFGATLGILLLAGPMAARLSKHAGVVVSAIAAMVAATVAAEVVLLPISAAVFSRVTVAGLVLNFAAIPGMAVTQLAGMTAVALSGVWPAAAVLCGGLAHVGVVVLLRSADLLEWVPWLSWQTPPVGWGWSIAYYAAIGVLIARLRMRLLRRLAWVAAVTSAGVILWAPPVLARPTSVGSLRVTMLDVGQGQAIAVQFPTGESLLVDAGGAASGFDVGGRVVTPALWALGIRRLDWMAVTHGDLDHAGGAESVLRDMRPREIWEGISVPRDARLQRLRTAAHSAGAVWRRLRAGESFEVGSVLVDVLHPSSPDWERQDVRNDDSIVLHVQFGHISVLLTGDIGRAVEESLVVDAAPRLRVLTAPHHGSRTSSSPALLRGWLPHAVLISAGQGNAFGHPAPDVLSRYAALGVPVFRTDRDGAITLDIDGREINIATQSGRRWQLREAEIRADRE